MINNTAILCFCFCIYHIYIMRSETETHYKSMQFMAKPHFSLSLYSTKKIINSIKNSYIFFDTIFP